MVLAAAFIWPIWLIKYPNIDEIIKRFAICGLIFLKILFVVYNIACLMTV